MHIIWLHESLTREGGGACGRQRLPIMAGARWARLWSAPPAGAARPGLTTMPGGASTLRTRGAGLLGGSGRRGPGDRSADHGRAALRRGHQQRRLLRPAAADRHDLRGRGPAVLPRGAVQSGDPVRPAARRRDDGERAGRQYPARAAERWRASAARQRVGGRHPEIWLYLRGTGRTRELVCKVFDTERGWTVGADPGMGKAPLDSVNGRGLQVVAGLSAGQWGCHLTRSRLGNWKVPGKAVWFALRIPPAVAARSRRAGPRYSPDWLIDELEAMLADRGLSAASSGRPGRHLRAVHQPAPDRLAARQHRLLARRRRAGTSRWTSPTWSRSPSRSSARTRRAALGEPAVGLASAQRPW